MPVVLKQSDRDLLPDHEHPAQRDVEKISVFSSEYRGKATIKFSPRPSKSIDEASAEIQSTAAYIFEAEICGIRASAQRVAEAPSGSIK